MKAPAAKRWENFNDYNINVYARAIGGPIWSVQVWKL